MTRIMPPLISVVIPLYNKGPYVETAIASALHADDGIHEVIVVDDGSTDDGPQRVARMGDPRVKLTRQRNQGVSAARNRGIREASGEFIAFLDADDYWTPDYIPQILALHRLYPQCAVYATHYFTFTEDGRTQTPRIYEVDPDGSPQLVTRFFEAWARNNIFSTCSVVIRRAIFFDHQIFFPENESLGEDQDVWFRIAERYPIAYSSRPLVAYRVGLPSSLSKASADADLPPFIKRLKERYNADRIPPQHRKGVSRLLGLHQLMLALRFLRTSSWGRGVSLLFNRFSIHAPRFWLKIFLLACLPRTIRLRVLERF
ncbi:glycosyltransferase family 2 protein [Noviherbaspirillum cavernae]|uniref:Glycosyltransferase family 2 protein n=1 Tax=Noviherbaspirillum cavernae TaxID=2320862 RepID=A0A418X0A6_9BURK|nr:glycosyltransferase family 2 protein [Noviherbaspirillum cavernae]RJG05773.1 glycosyltransferase family 2 protein [Noviherbaspirillum cavernae]